MKINKTKKKSKQDKKWIAARWNIKMEDETNQKIHFRIWNYQMNESKFLSYTLYTILFLFRQVRVWEKSNCNCVLVGWLVNWFIDTSVSLSVGWLVGLSVGWLVGWLVGPSVMGWSVGLLVDQSVCWSVGLSVSRLVGWSVSQSVSRSVVQLCNMDTYDIPSFVVLMFLGWSLYSIKLVRRDSMTQCSDNTEVGWA